MTGRNRRVQHQGTRNSTEAVLQPIAGTPNATEELRRVLQKAPDVGPVAVVYSKDFVHLSEPAMALSILAWPMETCVIPWDGSEGAWRRFAAARDGRRIFVGPAMAIPGYRFEPLGPQLWSVVKEEAR